PGSQVELVQRELHFTQFPFRRPVVDVVHQGAPYTRTPRPLADNQNLDNYKPAWHKDWTIGSAADDNPGGPENLTVAFGDEERLLGVGQSGFDEGGGPQGWLWLPIDVGARGCVKGVDVLEERA